MTFFKTKRKRMNSKELKKLNADVHERDGHCCIKCGRYVDPGEKFHHVRHGAYKVDDIKYSVLLCLDCHHDADNGKPKEMMSFCLDYLARIYGNEIYDNTGKKAV